MKIRNYFLSNYKQTLLAFALILFGIQFSFASNNDSLKSPVFKNEYITGLVSDEDQIRAGLLYDITRDKIVWDKRGDQVFPIASLTKMMVGLLAIEDLEAGKISMTDTITVTESFKKKIRRRKYTTYTVQYDYSLEDALKMAMVASHNESTIWIAKHCAPTIEEFVARMNQRAAELGMNSTKYYNTSGLPGFGPTPDNSSTPRDLLLLGMEIAKHPLLMNITSIPYATVSNGKFKTTYRNHNGLVINYNEEVDGIKTGFTRAAGFCLVSTCSRGGHKLMGVVLGCQSAVVRNGLVASMVNNYFDAIKLGRLGEGPIDGYQSRLFLDSVDRGLASIVPPIDTITKEAPDLKYAYSFKTVYEKTKAIHTVRKGDNLSKIADKYNVALADLKKWNKIKRNSIQSGQKLAIYKTVKKKIQIKIVVDPDEEKEDLACDDVDLKCVDEDVNASGIAKNDKSLIKEDAKNVALKGTATTTSIKRIKPVFIYHTVQPGDTLWRISQRYQLNIEEIKKANNISGNTLKKGVKIKIPVKG
ncbi:MAG: LysM peptidoglycan-binding domain-containing protein [Bacteroidota bacterium]